MPLPLGHAAIGLMTYETCSGNSAFQKWKRFIFIAALANLPDIDIIFGLLFQWNGNAFHRGPTHSLIFAVTAGVVSYIIAKRWFAIEGITYWFSIMLILSHVIADALLTNSPVSFFWPFEIYWSHGHAGWTDIVHSILFESLQDGWIVLCCGAGIVMLRWLRWYSVRPQRLTYPGKDSIEQ
jgi:membrane-bound metal-dependent hydrolase YbcI (DUF457 family)